MMKIISMNIRGVEGSFKTKYVRDLISKEQVDMIYYRRQKVPSIAGRVVVLSGVLLILSGLKIVLAIIHKGLFLCEGGIAFNLHVPLMGRIFLLLKGVEGGCRGSDYYYECLQLCSIEGK